MQFVPFVLVLAIFYFVILLPMKRRQKKVQQFLDALKVGDRVITTGGIYGTITQDRRPVGAAADRRQGPHRDFQGRDRGFPGPGPGRARQFSSMNNLRWRILLIVVIVGACLWAIIPPEQKIRLGLDLKGGVHLVLRVNTDDALRLETDDDRRAAARGAREGRRDRRAPSTVDAPTQFQVVGRAAGAGRGVPAGRGRRLAGDLRPRVRRRRRLHLHDEAERRLQLRDEAVMQAQQTIERRVNELGVAEPIVARQGGARRPAAGAAARRHRRGARQGDHPVHGACSS